MLNRKLTYEELSIMDQIALDYNRICEKLADDDTNEKLADDGDEAISNREYWEGKHDQAGQTLDDIAWFYDLHLEYSEGIYKPVKIILPYNLIDDDAKKVGIVDSSANFTVIPPEEKKRKELKK